MSMNRKINYELRTMRLQFYQQMAALYLGYSFGCFAIALSFPSLADYLKMPHELALFGIIGFICFALFTLWEVGKRTEKARIEFNELVSISSLTTDEKNIFRLSKNEA